MSNEYLEELKDYTRELQKIKKFLSDKNNSLFELFVESSLSDMIQGLEFEIETLEEREEY